MHNPVSLDGVVAVSFIVLEPMECQRPLVPDKRLTMIISMNFLDMARSFPPAQAVYFSRIICLPLTVVESLAIAQSRGFIPCI